MDDDETTVTVPSIPNPESPPSSSSSTFISHLPEETLHHIFSHLPLRQLITFRLVSKLFHHSLTTPPFPSHFPTLPLLALRHRRHHHPSSSLLAFDPSLHQWLRLPLSFLPSPSSPVTASSSLLYLWSDSQTLLLCNPLTRSYRLLPRLGSAWSRHGTVLAGPTGHVVVLTDLAALFCSGDRWLKFSLNLPSKPRSPILVGDDTLYAICDVGSPWRSNWKLFRCHVSDLGRPRGWDRLDRPQWGEVFDILRRPRIVGGRGGGRILLIGGLRSTFVVDAPCSTVLILRLDLGNLEWDEAGRMPPEMYQCFGGAGVPGGSNKVKLFGGDGMVWFSGKRMRGRMAMWEEGRDEVLGKSSGGVWRWVDGVAGYGDSVYRGFTFNAALTDVP